MKFCRSVMACSMLLLAACAAPLEAPQALPAELLKAEAVSLPGLAADEGEQLVLRYPAGTLFAAGAALPLAGGEEMLPPLAEWLQSHPQSRWQLRVRGDAGISPEKDLALAQKRAELLERFFRNRGLGTDRLAFVVEAGPGDTLELRLSQPAP